MALKEEREREERLSFLKDYSNYLLQGREQIEAGCDKMVSSLSGGALGILLVFFLDTDNASIREGFGEVRCWLIWAGVAFVLSIACGLFSLWISGQAYEKRSQTAMLELMDAMKSGKVPSLNVVYGNRTRRKDRWIAIIHHSSAIFLFLGLSLIVKALTLL